MNNMVGVCPGCVGCALFGPDWHTVTPLAQQQTFLPVSAWLIPQGALPPEYSAGMAQYRAPRDIEIERAARDVMRSWDDLASIADLRGGIELLRKALEQK